MRVLCSSRKPMRKTPVSGFPRALVSLSHARKRRALASRLQVGNRNNMSGPDEGEKIAVDNVSFNELI